MAGLEVFHERAFKIYNKNYHYHHEKVEQFELHQKLIHNHNRREETVMCATKNASIMEKLIAVCVAIIKFIFSLF